MTDRICTVEGCSKPFAARGMCMTHYSRVRRHGTTDKRPTWSEQICSVDACARSAAYKGYCSAHYTRAKRGKELDSPINGRDNRVFVDSRGYVHVSVPGQRNWPRQHRLVMEEMLGRPLVKGETVHHVNGDRADNRPENLELWSTSQPSGQRVDDKVQWAIELLELYRPEALAQTRSRP